MWEPLDCCLLGGWWGGYALRLAFLGDAVSLGVCLVWYPVYRLPVLCASSFVFHW